MKPSFYGLLAKYFRRPGMIRHRQRIQRATQLLRGVDVEMQSATLAIGQSLEQRNDNLLILAQLKPLGVVGGV
ncbi:hypothetical protein D3C77_791800 [compost metagenome]